MPPMSAPAKDQPNCLACRHFYITYEAGLPYGCKALGFKSRQYPAQVVFASSGMICQAFAGKKAGEEKNSSVN